MRASSPVWVDHLVAIIATGQTLFALLIGVPLYAAKRKHLMRTDRLILCFIVVPLSESLWRGHTLWGLTSPVHCLCPTSCMDGDALACLLVCPMPHRWDLGVDGTGLCVRTAHSPQRPLSALAHGALLTRTRAVRCARGVVQSSSMCA